jgi:hypothetical protein
MEQLTNVLLIKEEVTEFYLVLEPDRILASVYVGDNCVR